ncbi:TetR/AcrR family transcriptional regulator [Parasphingorhabdus sp.]|uniref:TetR/AcrR family transcriptional regulator n=1 Tax=Parasphingorhabdus sp. TaxID=2709688 RepID=UPI0032ECF972
MAHQLAGISRHSNTQNRKTKKVRILDEAAKAINDFGVGAVDLKLIAEAAGLSRNALYYYIKDRTELAHLSYARSCSLLNLDLTAAIEEESEPKQQLAKFVLKTLAPDRAPTAVVDELDYLQEAHRSEITRELQAIILRIREIFACGVQSGQFRAVDPLIMAHCLIGMINWARLASRWLGENTDTTDQFDLSSAIIDLLLNGFASSGSTEVRHPVDIRLLVNKPFNAFDRDDAAQNKASQLLAASSRLFNRHGIEGTSIGDIVADIGATKGVIYHYFTDKMDLVVQCYERAFRIYETFLEEAQKNGKTGFEKAMIVHHLNCQAQAGSVAPLMLQTGFESLPAEKRQEFVNRSRTIWLQVQSMLETGIKDGSCRQSNIEKMSEVAVGTFAWLAKTDWYSTLGSDSDIANQVCDIVGHGILTNPRNF